MPRPPKAAGTAVDRRNGQRVAVATGGKVPRFDPPEGLSAPAMAAWEDYWVDVPATVLTPSSRVLLVRWVKALDRYLRCSEEADLEPVVVGSTGQPRENPLYKVASDARQTLEACEKQLGIGVLNAVSLGIAVTTAKKSLADMNARYESAPEVPADDADPRLHLAG